jgi:hypothetical protein
MVPGDFPLFPSGELACLFISSGILLFEIFASSHQSRLAWHRAHPFSDVLPAGERLEGLSWS